MFYRVIEKTNLKFERRIKILGAAFGLLFVIILIRAAWLQILQGEKFLQLSQSSRLRAVPILNPRGLILDREQRIVADNSASFSVGIVPENVKDVTEILLKLKKILPGMDIKIAEEKIKNTPNPFRPVVLQRNVDLSTITYLLEREEEFPPVVILAQPIRHYPQGELLGNVIGYVGEVNKQELKIFSSLGVEAGDFIGKIGIERRYNFYLQGEKGGRQVEMDAYGRALRVISEKQPSPGSILQLTIDLEMQKIAKEEMGERKGVVLISDPRTGQILTMLSLPSFDPNLLARGISEERWKKLSQHPGNPMENRAIRGEYPPGSTFKIVVTAAALEEKIAQPETTFFCPGSLQVGNRVFKCWKEGGHGKIDLKEALVHSCDVYFYQLGLKVGVEKIIHYAKLFGLGQMTGVDLISEKRGILPTPEWKKENFKEPWYPGDTANLSIGQGYLLVTPIQMLKLINAVANGGYLMKPYLVQKITTFDGKVILSFSPEKVGRLPFSSSTLNFIREALAGVVERGTGWRAKSKKVAVAGKTGTAQIEGENPHNWFVGYAPAENPLLSIVVLVENREEEISIAPLIAGRIFSRIFENSLN